MKITKRQLIRIIREAVGDDFFSDREANPHDDGMYGEPEGGYSADEGLTGDDALIDALIFGWAEWADDNGQPDPGLFAPQEKGDAALSWVSKNEPDIARQISALSTHKLKALYDAAFDKDTDRGHKTSAMDWNR